MSKEDKKYGSYYLKIKDRENKINESILSYSNDINEVNLIKILNMR